MSAWPVIQREFRAASRRRATWQLRVIFTSVAIATFVFGLAIGERTPQARGMMITVCLATTGFLLSLLAGAFLTSDCISSEKREGTLGLLFLTPLNGFHVVLGKMAIHGLQVGYAWIAVCPMFYIPASLGGVTAGEIARILVVLFGTLMFSLAWGVCWSVFCLEARTTLMATLATMLLANFVPWLPELLGRLTGGGTSWPMLLEFFSPMTALICAFESRYQMGGPWASGRVIFWIALAVQTTTTVGLLVIAGWKLPGVWNRFADSSAPTPRKTTAGPALETATATEQEMGPDPLGWLFRRRLKQSGWLVWFRGILVCFVGLMLAVAVVWTITSAFNAAVMTAYAIHFLIRAELAAVATKPWHEDSRSGAFELLLTSPIAESEITQGHLAATRKKFVPALATLLGVNLALILAVLLCGSRLHIPQYIITPFCAMFAGGILVTLADFELLGWLGIREGLRASTSLQAMGRALGWLYLGPVILGGIMINVVLKAPPSIGAHHGLMVWYLLCVLYAAILKSRCKDWLAPGLRARVTEER